MVIITTKGNHIMKRIITAFLTLVLSASMFSVNSFATDNSGSLSNFKKVNTINSKQFLDVPDNEWYYENVVMAYELGLMKGYSRTAFNPSENLTIAEAIALACRLHSIYYADGEQFVQGSPWYQVYIDYALNNDIITSKYEDYTISASRGSFAYILAGSLPDEALQSINTISEGAIPDVGINDYYSSAIYKLYRSGILTGNDSLGTFTPNDKIARSAVAAIITRMCNKSLRQSFSLILKANVYADKIETTKTSYLLILSNTNFKKIYANIYPYNMDEKVLWISSNNNVVSVMDSSKFTYNQDYKPVTTATGKIIPISEGTATITVCTPSGISAAINVTVISENDKYIEYKSDLSTEEMESRKMLAANLESTLNQQSFCNVKTPLGALRYNFKVDALTSNFDSYADYSIRAETTMGLLPWYDLKYSNSYSDESKLETIELLCNLQGSVFSVAEKELPATAKIKGCFYDDGYKYPHLKVGYSSTTEFSWANFDSAYSEKAEKHYSVITQFHWTPILDEYQF